jgi:hypothetical protein
MSFIRSRRLAIAGITVAAALGAGGTAQAAPVDCEGGAEQVVQQFREIEAKKGYDAAVKWWDGAWRKYHDRCVI